MLFLAQLNVNLCAAPFSLTFLARFGIQASERGKPHAPMIQAEIKAVVEKSGAITPDLIAALQAFGDKDLVLKAAEAMAPLSIIGGSSIGEVLSKLLSGTRLEGIAKLATSNPNNGASSGQSAHR